VIIMRAATFETISADELETVDGGNATTRVAGRVLRKVGSKFVPGLNVASTIYDAYEGVQGYQRARQQGAGRGRAAWEGVKSFAGFGSE
jgi:hypothetical protein